MKKKIAILGSTGSIGNTLVDIIKKDKKNFEIVLLSAKSNYKKLFTQAKYFKVKNLIITNYESYLKIKKYKYSKNIKIFNSFDQFKKIFKTKVDYTMSSITGIEGLKPTLDIIKYSKKIAIANKESIICGWGLIDKELKKNKTKFVPVDSEHFSIWSVLKNNTEENIDKVFITASGGPFYNLPLSKFSKIKVKDAIKHPNWSMGKKISVDSATMMNKVFEIIEAKNIFNIPINKLKILIHRDSYLHAIIKFTNGLSHMIVHDTNMKIPIFNTLYENKKNLHKLKSIDLRKLSKLNLEKPNLRKFPVIKVFKKINSKTSLFETLIVSTNDTLVDLFLEKKIKFSQIAEIFFSTINEKKFSKYKSISPKSIDQIIKVKNIVQKKIKSIYT